MADQHHDDHGHGHGAVQVDEQQPPNAQLFGWGLIVAIVFFGSAAFITTVFYPMLERITQTRFQEEQDRVPAVRAQRSLEEQRLTSYGYVDQQKGIAHIPVAEGMKKVIEESKR
jgi:hypothetical protein